MVIFRAVIPQTDGAVAMLKKEVAIQISADDTDLFAVPPLCFKRAPVVLSNQAGNLEHPFTAPDFISPTEFSSCLLHQV